VAPIDFLSGANVGRGTEKRPRCEPAFRDGGEETGRMKNQKKEGGKGTGLSVIDGEINFLGGMWVLFSTSITWSLPGRKRDIRMRVGNRREYRKGERASESEVSHKASNFLGRPVVSNWGTFPFTGRLGLGGKKTSRGRPPRENWEKGRGMAGPGRCGNAGGELYSGNLSCQ